MAYTAGGLTLMSTGNGFGHYRYDILTDVVETVEVAGYFNNLDDSLALVVGDMIDVFTWTTAVRTGTLDQHGTLAVTNVIDNDAASSAGAVNTASINQAGQVVSSLG